MPYKTLIFGTDELFPQLQPFYMQAVKRGILDIVAYAELNADSIRVVTPDGKPWTGNESPQFELVIISSQENSYRRMKHLEAQGIPRNRIIDGRVFQVPNLDFERLLNEGVAHGVLDKNSFVVNSYTIYPRVYAFQNSGTLLALGTKTYIESGRIDGGGLISLGKFSSVSWEIKFRLGENYAHNHRNVGMYVHTDWHFPAEFYPPQGACKILIGNDVWIGRSCILKCTNPNKPLIIGDGAVVAADSVVVKSVPPYAIVGGNPARIIKYRFSEDVIESFLRIKWWDWSLDKLHDNFKYFNDIEKFISMHDNQR